MTRRRLDPPQRPGNRPAMPAPFELPPERPERIRFDESVGLEDPMPPLMNGIVWAPTPAQIAAWGRIIRAENAEALRTQTNKRHPSEYL